MSILIYPNRPGVVCAIRGCGELMPHAVSGDICGFCARERAGDTFAYTQQWIEHEVREKAECEQ